MGNGSSQSVILGSPRLQTSYPIHNGYHYQRGMPKFVHPQNRVLPKPIAGQRLRSTDNGSILQTAGTIRGQRQDSGDRGENIDSEVMGILRRRSEMIEKESDSYTNLRSNRMFHSDPDIARRTSPDSYRIEEKSDSYGNRRSCGGVAIRTSKLKHKKKQRAPEPPPNSSSLPRQMERRPQSRCGEDRINSKSNLQCRCINKSKAPQPPPVAVQPPPPPPLPSSVTTRTKIGHSQNSTNLKPGGDLPKLSPSPFITRAVECHDSNKHNYEKNVHPLEKWRNCRSTGDIRIDEEDESPSNSRTTVFNSKAVSDHSSKIPSYLPQKPDPFQKEIQAVTKKIAESRQEKLPTEMVSNSKKPNPAKNMSEKRDVRNNSPPKFYFADTEVFKKDSNTNSKVESTTNGISANNSTKTDNVTKSSNGRAVQKSYHPKSNAKETTSIDEIVPSLQRFSPSRQHYKSHSRVSTPTPTQKAEKGWDDLSRNIYNKQDEDSDIDIRLRPVLPRKPLEMPKFSASEAWQALGSDGLSSNQSTSDDGPESVSPYKKSAFVTGAVDSRRLSDVPFSMYEKMNNGYKLRSMSDSHWTPRQDLLDDSDVSSIGSEEAVVPRIRPNSIDIPTRFSMPSVMFSNMRPIGSEYTTNGMPYFSENAKSKHNKKKSSKLLDSEYKAASNFKKFLSKKNKFVSEEDVTMSDSNWTFGQYGLQKRGKQYSSDLMLSDKKKHELMMKSNFSEILGDILVNKANHMRSQMKSSDSGNSNFSFYSTEGQILYMPEKGGFVQENECSPPTRGRVYDIRRRFDPNFETPTKPSNWIKSGKKKPNQSDLDLGRRRDLELAKMLEDEVRKRRNKEKITIRQQLQKIKNMNTDDDDDFDDEAYFTEPKSREECQSPFFHPGPSHHFPNPSSILGHKPFRFSRFGCAVTTSDSSRLSHWQSSPALLEDSTMKNGPRPVPKGNFSSSSVMSSPDPETWTRHSGMVDSWLQRQRNMELGKRHLGSVPILEHSPDEGNRLPLAVTDNANDGDISSSPTPAPQKKKERRKTNIYKQLMDIVRKEEKQLRNNQQGNPDPNSRNSSSHCESSPSTTSEASSLSSAYSYSDSSGSKSHGKNGVSANKEFHTSSYTNTAAQNTTAPSFQVSFVQPYTPSKSYRPVPFEVNSTASNIASKIQGDHNRSITTPN